MFKSFIVVLALICLVRSFVSCEVTFKNDKWIHVVGETVKSLSSSNTSATRLFLFLFKDPSASSVVFKYKELVPIQVMKSTSFIEKDKGSIIKSSITFITVREIKELDKFLNRKVALRITEKVLLVLEAEHQLSSINSLFTKLLSLDVVNVSVLTVSGDDFVIVSFFPYQNGDCKNSSPIITNVFNKSSLRWKHEVFFPQKFRNFFGCPLRISTLEYPPAVMKSTDSGMMLLQGSDIEVIKGLSTSLNFTLNFAYVAEPYNFGVFHGNGSVSGAISRLASGDADIAMGFYFLSNDKLKYLSNCNP